AIAASFMGYNLAKRFAKEPRKLRQRPHRGRVRAGNGCADGPLRIEATGDIRSVNLSVRPLPEGRYCLLPAASDNPISKT
ncbi:hypothetical protein MTR72_40070, partial [Bradyrhizobium sp. ISRA442]